MDAREIHDSLVRASTRQVRRVPPLGLLWLNVTLVGTLGGMALVHPFPANPPLPSPTSIGAWLICCAVNWVVFRNCLKYGRGG